jgi:hypothetical protein
MCGVDSADQHVAYYPNFGKKNGQKLLMYLPMCAAWNAHILHKLHYPGSRFLDFMSVVIEQLIASSVPMEENGTNYIVTPRTCDRHITVYRGHQRRIQCQVWMADFTSHVTEVTWK